MTSRNNGDPILRDINPGGQTMLINRGKTLGQINLVGLVSDVEVHLVKRIKRGGRVLEANQ